MVCEIIWADRVMKKGAKVAIGFKKMDIVAIKKIYKKKHK